jgi:hypothetical protein
VSAGTWSWPGQGGAQTPMWTPEPGLELRLGPGLEAGFGPVSRMELGPG